MKRYLPRGIIIGVAATLLFLAGYLSGTKPRFGDVPFVEKQTHWMISVLSAESPQGLAAAAAGSDPPISLSAADVTDVRADYVADPFLIRRHDRWYMFFEVLTSKDDQGDIGLATSPDGKDWTYERIVLDEPFHLSYPYVFEWEGDVYMIPETREAGELRLYRAVDFPYSWRLDRSLMTGIFRDPSIVRHEDRWWLFSSPTRRADALRLHWADSLHGSWLQHPSSPVVIEDRRRARPGGRVVRMGDRLVRWGQDGVPAYGTAVRGYEISVLTPTEYRERPLEPEVLFQGDGEGWNATGMHHVDLHRRSDGSWIATVDGYREGLRWRLNW